MRACCNAAGVRKSTGRVRTVREFFSWALPGAILVAVPKCPACLAAYVMLWTGLGLSLPAAAYLRWMLLFACGASLFFLLITRLNRVGSFFFKRETES
jgi:hypothetical protein